MKERDPRPILVTGGSSDIGRAIIHRLLEADQSVVSQCRSVPQDLPSGPNIEWKTADLSNDAGVSGFLDEVAERGSGFQGFIHCAGVIEGVDWKTVETAQMENTFWVNAFSFFMIARALFDKMEKNNGGRLIALSSIGVKFAGSSHSTIYSASKRALEGFAMSLSRQGAAKGILSNVIRVGVTDTRIHRVPGKVMEARKEMIPLKRMASPDEIAGATMFLLGPDAAFITGAIIPVSGGE